MLASLAPETQGTQISFLFSLWFYANKFTEHNILWCWRCNKNLIAREQLWQHVWLWINSSTTSAQCIQKISSDIKAQHYYGIPAFLSRISQCNQQNWRGKENGYLHVPCEFILIICINLNNHCIVRILHSKLQFRIQTQRLVMRSRTLE